MPEERDRDLFRLSERLDYAFKDLSLLDLALTHASARAALSPQVDNERLEFLGDRVLGLAIAELLTGNFPSASEGELARRYNRLVRADSCAEIATQWGLGDLILMSGGEAESGGRQKKNILANACEAVLGAVFSDGGYEAANRIVQRFWTGLEGVECAGDAKSVLQEWAQGRRLPLPHYVEIAREGPDHAPSFTAEVRIDGVAPERGQGASKRAAEQAAALALLRREGIWPASDNE